MRYVVLLVLLLGFTVPVQAGEVDGKGLFCSSIMHLNDEGTVIQKKTDADDKIVDVYLFQDGKAHTLELQDTEIVSKYPTKYKTTSLTITWYPGAEDWGSGYPVSLDRKSLLLSARWCTNGVCTETMYVQQCSSAQLQIQLESKNISNLKSISSKKK